MNLLPFARRGAWRRYTTADGLAANQTEHIVEDGEGYLWIATVTGGVSRFDGDQFRTYTTRNGLPADVVYALLVDDGGRLWCGTYRGVCWQDGEGFRPFEQEGCAAGEGVTFLCADRRGWVWLQGWKVFGYWDGEEYVDLAPEVASLTGGPPGIGWGICEDESGAVWAAGRRHVVRWTDGRLEPVSLPQGPEKVQMWETCLAAHPDGGVWHSDGHRLGIWRDGGYAGVAVEIRGFVRKILPDRQGRTWFCLSGGDMAALVWEGGRFCALSASEVGYDRIHGFHEDREGSLWFATWGGGLTCFDPAGPFTLGVADGLPSAHVARLAQDREHRLWVGFGDLYSSVAGYLQGGRFCVVPETARHAAGLLARADGSVWFAGAAGVSRWRDGRFEEVLYTGDIRPGTQARGRVFTSLAEDDPGRLLLGWRCGEAPMELGISRFDGTALEEIFALVAPDPFSAVVAFAPTAGGLWFAVGAFVEQGLGYGLGFLDDAGQVTWYLPADGLVHERIEALHLDRAGHLWIATLGGISRFDGATFTNYTTDNGLPHHHVRSIAEDDSGHLWFGTDAGVARFDGATFQLVRLGVGSPIRSIARDPTGQWWFATLEGLVGYRPSSTPPRVRIVQTVTEQAYRGRDALAVTTAARQILFEYQGMSFRTRAADLLYRGRLLGHEEAWRPATRQRRAFYRNLPPGDYTFQVRAVDRDLNESEPAQVHLHVAPDERDRRIDELTSLAEALGASGAGGPFVGESPALRQTLAQLRQVAPTEATVLISGETGTGKGLAARAVHAQSPRKAGPFVTVSCGALPAGLVESELFGHEQGAFTGALRRQLGKVELARQGTLFLDEIGDLPLEAQAKLLRLLEEGAFERVGGAEERPCEARVIAATNRPLEQMVAAGSFRADLFFRLQVVPVRLPPLRERREDIPLLAAFFAERMAAHLNKPLTQFAPAVLERLQNYEWPGNVRELEHAIQRAVIVCPGSTIRAADLALGAEGREAGPVRERLTLQEQERRYIRQVLAQTGGVIGGPEGAAAVLGVPESTLRYRLKKLGLVRS